MSQPARPFRFALQAAWTEKLLRHRERWGISHYSVRPPAQDALGPVIARLTSR